MTLLFPKDWTPAVRMDRIVAHWTAGGNTANATDKKAYHLLVEGDGKYVRGVASIERNSGSIKDGYAAHTLNCNTNSIGISMCGMAGAVESPFNAGRAPITRVQFEAAAAAVAFLCGVYGIAVTPKTVLFHAEVQANLGITQRNKWDVARLPFDPSVVGAKAIGDHFRALVSAAIKGKPAVQDPVAPPVPEGARVRVSMASLAFRKGPADDALVTGSLPNGTALEVLDVEANWLRVQTPAKYTGWVERAGVEIIDGPPAQSPTVPNPIRAKIAEIRVALDALEALL